MEGKDIELPFGWDRMKCCWRCFTLFDVMVMLILWYWYIVMDPFDWQIDQQASSRKERTPATPSLEGIDRSQKCERRDAWGTGDDGWALGRRMQTGAGLGIRGG
uniref:Bm10033 n=1 Tax=Brugia malayi TaxID=6279 RepID=A0A0J9XWA5_BRUMA|nr:Bm10033 [Brugia malayi]